MLLVVIGALIGLWLRGFPGMVLGGIVGFALGRLARNAVSRRLLQVQAQFLETGFAVMGAMCKADGVVTRDEIRVTEAFFARLQLSPEQTEAAKAAFRRGKASDFDLDGEVDRFARTGHGGRVLFDLFLQMQLLAVAADGEIHPAEHELLVRVARRLGLAEVDVARLEALLRAAGVGATTSGGLPTKQRLDDAYAALGVSPDASDAEVKAAYRKLMIENHPDRVAAKGLPDGMREIAEERAREINVAYDLVKQARGAEPPSGVNS